jgi:hypothetical protein
MKVEALCLCQMEKARGKDCAFGKLKFGKDGFEIASYLFALKGNNELSQNVSPAGARLLDTPIRHKIPFKRRHGKLLEEFLVRAIFNEYLIKRKKDIVAFIQGGEEPNFPWFTPPEWTKPLRIPVDFIRLVSFSGLQDGPVTAHVQIGHHIIFWNVELYNPRNKDPFRCKLEEINDKRILSVFKRLLSKPENKEQIQRMSRFGCITSGLEIIDKVPGCNQNSLPPRIRFY